MKFLARDRSQNKGAANIISRLKSYSSSPDLAITIVICLFLLIGVWIVTDYGESWDEHARYEYAKHSLVAYEGKYRELTDEKGPFFGMVAFLGTRIITSFTKAWREIDAWHFMTFLSFLMGMVFFYYICKRLVNSRSALGATLLFGTQPLLWGHAFINPKDIPFMSFFLGSVSLGMVMVDVFKKRSAELPAQKGNFLKNSDGVSISNSWQRVPTSQKSVFIISTLFLIFLTIGRNAILEGIAWTIRQAYTATGSNWLADFFNRFAQNADQIPVNDYILKGQVFFTRLALPVIVSLVLIILIVLNKIFIEQIRWIFYGGITLQTILAGIFLGFSSAIRVLGLASGLLVGMYFLLKSGKKAIPTLILYFCIGAAITYLAWPGLWNAPIKNYIHALNQTSDFSWSNKILFNGTQYYPQDIPSNYLPTLLVIQFSEIALLFILLGIVLSFIEVRKHPDKRLDLLILAMWFLAPIAQVIILHTTVYDNFRQLLFIIPPLFILSSLTFQQISNHLKSKAVYTFITLLTILPSIYCIIHLHPYEYIYYNSLVGGVKGAFRRFELDYWATSYKQATEYLNQIAPDGSFVLVRGPSQIAQTYARSDLIIKEYPRQGTPLSPPDYVLISSRNNEDLSIYPETMPVFKITRSGATLAVVKQISTPSSGDP